MELTLPLSGILLIAITSIGVFFSLLMSLLLFTKKEKNHLSIYLLAALLLVAGCTLFNELLVGSGISNRIRQLYFVPLYYTLSIGPLLYLFIKSKFRYHLEKTDYLHLVVPAFQAILYFSIGFRSVAYKAELWGSALFRFYLTAESFLFPASLFLYSFMALRIIRKQGEPVFFWSDDIRKWLNRFIKGSCWLAAIECMYSLIEYSGIISPQSGFPVKLVHGILLSAFVCWICLNSVKQYFPLQVFTSKPKHNGPAIDTAALSELSEKLLMLMDTDKVYLNPELSLALLAGYLGVSEKSCSFLLNKRFQSNFNQFINGYRIEAFKQKIRQGKHRRYTLTSLAYQCGFDSKATFNRVFKMVCGVTPSVFIRMNQG